MRTAGRQIFHSGYEAGTAVEIDVFELSGRGEGWARRFQTNVHVFHTPTDRTHRKWERAWTAPWDLADDFHVYGLRWEPDEIVFHVDGCRCGGWRTSTGTRRCGC